MKILLFVLLFCLSSTVAYKCSHTVNTYDGLVEYNEDWGYVDIREGAHTFWWLYSVNSSSDRPWILWLQGGPGASSTGFGNFVQNGPKTMDDKDNLGTFLQVADVVYVDNPVGAGFSYVDNDTYLTTNVEEIGQDLLEWLQQFLSIHDEYRSRPFYIFCESYGGKMGVEFARVINQEVAARNLKVNLRGVALGNSWISPIDYHLSYAPYLYANGFLDDHGLANLTKQAENCKQLIEGDQWDEAIKCMDRMRSWIPLATRDLSWYSIVEADRSEADHLNDLMLQAEKYLNTVVRKKLGIIPDHVEYKDFAEKVVVAQRGDFFKANWKTVDELLRQNTNVIVFNGNLDVICNVLGTNYWMNRLTWDKIENFHHTKRKVFRTNATKLAGYSKIYDNLQYWTIQGAGHMVFYDKPESAIYMVKQIFNTTASSLE